MTKLKSLAVQAVIDGTCPTQGHDRDTVTAETAVDVFGGLFDPLVAECASTIRWPACFTADARQGLQSALTARLVWLYELALYEDFAIFRTVSGRGQDGADAAAPDWFDVWWQGMVADGGFERFHDQRPVLTRYRDLITDDWITNTQALVDRFDQDRAALIEAGLLDQAAGAVVTIGLGLSDPHDGGQTVAILRFASGAGLVYKPRPMAVDVRFAEFLAALNTKGAPQVLRTPRVLAMDGYGWAELIEPTPLKDAEGATRFYARAGALLALLQRLRATDFHFENVIASGDCPVPVDLETLFQPLDNPARPTPIRAAMVRKTVQSLFSTHYVFAGRAGEIGGLAHDEISGDSTDDGADDGDGAEAKFQDWRYTNARTGAMRRGLHPIDPPARTNLPVLDGKAVKPKEYAAAMVEGYHHYQAFLEQALDPDWAEQAFGDIELRWVRRPTEDYCQLLNSLRMPDVLTGDRSVDAVLDPQLTAPWPELVAAEKAALGRLDIPKFMFRLGDDRVWEGSELVGRGAFTPADPWPSFGWSTRAEAAALGITLEPQWVLQQTPALDDDQDALSADAALAEARRLGDHLLDRVTMVDGRANWHVLDVPAGSKQLDVCPMGPDLYSGLPGPVIFLTLLSQVTGDTRYADIAAAGAQTLTDHIVGQTTRPMPSGGFSGPLSGAYGLDLAAELAGKPTPPDVLNLAYALSPEALRSDQHLDIIGGAAGLILILIRLWRRTGNPGFLDRADIAGRVLSERAAESEDGLWRTAGAKQPLLGFSHGASGFIYALTQLCRIRPNPMYDELIARAYRFEGDVSARAGGAWPDLRADGAKPETAGCPSQWCHGAAGVALARVLCADDPRAVPDIDRALAHLAAPRTSRLDDLCCGVMGQVLILDQLGRRMARNDIRQVAARRAAACVTAAQQSGTYRVYTGDMFYANSLMKGAAGIGYALLALAAPNRLPNILSLD
ncbi:MAG: type 2 lanthipeptide synthetase LanM family protein [Pseudomonadota bacterium]